MLTVPVLSLLCVVSALASPPAGHFDTYGNERMSEWSAQNPMASQPVPFYNPADKGGTMFDNTGNGLGEPLNVSCLSFLAA